MLRTGRGLVFPRLCPRGRRRRCGWSEKEGADDPDVDSPELLGRSTRMAARGSAAGGRGAGQAAPHRADDDLRRSRRHDGRHPPVLRGQRLRLREGPAHRLVLGKEGRFGRHPRQGRHLHLVDAQQPRRRRHGLQRVSRGPQHGPLLRRLLRLAPADQVRTRDDRRCREDRPGREARLQLRLHGRLRQHVL